MGVLSVQRDRHPSNGSSGNHSLRQRYCALHTCQSTPAALLLEDGHWNCSLCEEIVLSQDHVGHMSDQSITVSEDPKRRARAKGLSRAH